MSDHSARPLLDSEATSGTCSRAHPQSSWMSHWIKRAPKPASVVNNNSSLVCYKNEDIDTRLKIKDNFPKPFKGLGLGKEVVDEMGPRMVNENRTEKTGDFLNKINHSPSVSAFNACHGKAHMDDEFGDKAMSLALFLGKQEIVKNFDALKKTHLRKTEKRPMCPTYHNGGTTDLRLSTSSRFAPDQAHNGDSSSPGGPLVVFERHFSNDNFTCLDKGHCKYQKFSTFLFHEKKTNNNENNNNSLDPRQSDEKKNVNNFLPFHPKGRSENTHRAPRSVRNVETMRICTMVDSVENSPGGPPKIISQRSHHFLFTKETCVNVSEGNTFGSSSPRAQGVKIQPLWTSTDSEEKENTGNNPSSTCKACSGNDGDESSSESEPTRIKDPENQHTVMFGSESSPLNKDDTVDSSTEKARSKRPITEIPDINEDLPGLKPAVSSTDITDPTTSRIHSFDTKKLFFPCGGEEQTVLNDQNAPPPLGPDDSGTSRWIKRLKSSDSSGIGTRSSNPLEEASSSHEKFSLFLNKIMKSHKTPIIEENTLSGPHGTRSFVGPNSFASPSEKNQTMVLGGSWIQRWCSNPTTITTPTTPMMRNNNPENLVICEPHTLKFSSTQEELSKKQFPSIAAMALMGKAMNGFRPCEFRKMGPVVVWKANEY